MGWNYLRFVIGLVCGVSLVSCGEDKYRYPCQDPANWGSEKCEPPLCDADGTCTKYLVGSDVYDIWKQRAKKDSTGVTSTSGIPESFGGVSHSGGLRMRDGWCGDVRNLWASSCDAASNATGSERLSLDRDSQADADFNRVDSGNSDSGGSGQGKIKGK